MTVLSRSLPRGGRPRFFLSPVDSRETTPQMSLSLACPRYSVLLLAVWASLLPLALLALAALVV